MRIQERHISQALCVCERLCIVKNPCSDQTSHPLKKQVKKVGYGISHW